MPLPPLIQQYLSLGQELFEKGCVEAPLFSRGTYHIEVKDHETSFFPFLQLEDNGKILDSFCTCKVSESGQGCPHLSAAYLRIYQHISEPLHVRFKKSLWNQMFQLCSKKIGNDPTCFETEGNKKCCNSKTKKTLFSIELKTKKAEEAFQEIVTKQAETEETSLKFSQLTPEELNCWRSGKASNELSYELSFWSDLAKWIMMLADADEPYEIHFLETKQALPREMSVSFPDLTLWFYISDVNWPSIIPTLTTVRSPLEVNDSAHESLEKITYDEESKSLLVERKTHVNQEKAQPPSGIVIGEYWIYRPFKGFYRKQPDQWLLNPVIPSEKIASVLNAAAATLKQFLSIHPTKLPAQYHLEFDSSGNLHLELYVFQYGDLQQPHSCCFFPWVYLAGQKTFYHLEGWMFEGKEKVIEKAHVAEFINQHRLWLFQFPGFQTHLGSLEARLTYELNAKGQLVFSAKLDYPDQFADTIDLGQWVYIKGQGFYTKKESQGRFFLHPGLTVEPSSIASFIEAHKDDLEQVEHFYNPKNPVAQLGLTISLTEDQEISIAPQCQYAAEVKPQDIQVFGHFIYEKEKGFFELPLSMRLPERYREPLILSSGQGASFLAYELEPLKPWISFLDPKIQKPTTLELKIRKILRSKRTKGEQWFVDLIYESNIGWVDIFTIWDAFQQKKRYLFSKAGLLSLKDPRFNWIRGLRKPQLDRVKGLIRLNTLEWIRLSVFEEIKLPHDEEAQETKHLLDQISRFETGHLMNISKLKAHLRPYQETGLHWLWFLYCHHLSGLLCDDMGLGKTHQAMALLAAISSEESSPSKKYLVVCPTSVIYHWQELLKTFLPDIRVSTYYGGARTLDHFERDFDLLLTSYGILRTGKEDLGGLYFELAIFDEIQIAKNQHSQTHAALKHLKGKMRLGLTGTPIENRIRELKSLFDIVLPGYMPSDAAFREMFVTPIEKEKNEKQRELLTKLVKPFMLRRKKSEVLLDLPEKTEVISYCDLSHSQKELYKQVAFKMKNTVYQELCDTEKPVSYVHIFSALSTLKRICDHPALIEGHKLEPTSGKWDLFIELLSEARESGQKVVVFSQYLEMIAIIEKYLKKKEIGFASIKGSTQDRSGQLKRFREDPTCEVFVASLLAAGVGIDLTVASVVIHYDRWWNPAKENQATDRVHRIGQNRGVQVFKLVTKHTIEEHIHNLIEKKKGLIEEIVGYDEASQIRYLSRGELVALFETVFSDVNI